MPKTPTVKYVDIAKVAGVSLAKVCRALSGRSDISSKEAERIKAVAEQMGYQGNRLASSVKTGRSRIIGCLINQLTNPYNNEVMAGMEEAASRNDYAVIFTDGTSHMRRKLQRLLSYRMDVFVMTFTPTEAELGHMAGFMATNCPRVISQPTEMPGWGEVSVDHELACRQLVDHLVSLGHRKIGFACGTMPEPKDNPRLRGYLAALSSYGLEVNPEWILLGGSFPDTMDGGFSAAARYLDATGRPTAVIAHNDTSAMGLLLAFRNGGLSVPQDISICGFDGLRLFSPMVPELTTIDTRNYRWGQRLVEVAIKMVETGEVVKESHPWELRVGGTTGTPLRGN